MGGTALLADDDAHFLHGIFEGMTRIEGDAYDLLRRMGASSLTEVGSLAFRLPDKCWWSNELSELIG